MAVTASALTRRERIEIRELLKELRGMGKTIIISSHILHELAELCTTVGILEHGELLYHGKIDDIVKRAKLSTRILVRTVEKQDLAALLMQRTAGVRSVEEQNGALVVELDDQTHDFSHIAATLVKNNFKIREIKEEEVNLETAFMRLTKGLIQ